ncbi:hypothetical protein BH20ACT11_BH20ACT11_10100 [soil metagenome]
MVKRVFAPVAVVAAAFVLVMSFVISAQAIGAQGTAATPAPQGETEVAPSHPAHIHSGTCDMLGEVVYPLNDVTLLGIDVAPASTPVGATPAAVAGTDSTPVAAEAVGPGEVVAESTTDVEVTLDELLSGEYAINVHESAENIQNYIACGNITGDEVEDGELTIDLMELNDSGFTGTAVLTNNEDGTTTVSVTLIQTGTAVTGTPVATPSS